MLICSRRGLRSGFNTVKFSPESSWYHMHVGVSKNITCT